MDNVLNFPSGTVRDRERFEREIRAGLNDSGVPPEDIELVLSRMAEFIDIVCRLSSTNGDISQGLPDPLSGSAANALVSERVKAEIIRLHRP